MNRKAAADIIVGKAGAGASADLPANMCRVPAISAVSSLTACCPKIRHCGISQEMTDAARFVVSASGPAVIWQKCPLT